MKVITPGSYSLIKEALPDSPEISIFLAGTIDDGDSKNWQKEIIDKLIPYYMFEDLTIYNPRRDDWNSNATNKDIEEQIKWEQEKLEKCDIILMVILEDSKSPISLMELGEFCDSQKIMVFCPEKFYRYLNVKDLCLRKYIPLFLTNDIDMIKNELLTALSFLKDQKL